MKRFGMLVGILLGAALLLSANAQAQENDPAAVLTVEEYPIVAAAEDSPSHFEFMDRVPASVLDQRRAWREPDPDARIAAINAVIGQFDYALVPLDNQDPTRPMVALTYRDQVLVDDISSIGPLTVNRSGTDFRLLVYSETQWTLLVVPVTVAQYDLLGPQEAAPVFVGDDLIEVQEDWNTGSLIVTRSGETIFTYPVIPSPMPPAAALWSWEDHWVLEIAEPTDEGLVGQVIIDGQNLNDQLGYDEIFGWRLIAGEPLYFFRQDGEIGLSFARQILPNRYEDVAHYMCCEPSMFNVGGNDTMIWFYALRDGMWYYVEAGVYE